MKRLVSASAAIALGTVGVASPLIATPAHAVSTADPCANSIEPLFSDAMDNWFQTCTPLYGSGKVEFTISSDVDFPAGFQDLSGAMVTSSNGNVPEIESYYNMTGLTGNFTFLSRRDDHSNPRLQRYSFVPYWKVTSASLVSTGTLPASCTAFVVPYAQVYALTFDPVDVTFAQTVDGDVWEYRIHVAPSTMYVAGTLSPLTFDESDPLCVTQGEMTLVSETASADEGLWNTMLSDSMVANPYPQVVGSPYVGDFPRYTPPAPELPDTGLSTSQWFGLAPALAAVGVVFLNVRRRRAQQ